MHELSPIDAAFLRMETPRTPMHVGGLMIFRLPDPAPSGFLRELLAQLRTTPFLPPPFTSRLERRGLHRLLPAWVECDHDLDYHIRHSALPYPGGERELGVLVARLHSHPLDLKRPPWELHLIEGLERNRFALYFKAHHCAVDGMGAMRLVRGWLSEDPGEREGPPPWQARGTSHEQAQAWPEALRHPLRAARQQWRAARELADVLRKLSAPGQAGGVRAALATPRSLFNRRISSQRRLGTQVLELARIKAIGEATGATVNDVCLALCGGAIRRYLLERDALPKKTLIASVPLGLPRADGKPGNAVAGFVCPLGTSEADPCARVRLIHEVTTAAKEQLRAMSAEALAQFALLGLAPLILGQMAGVLSYLPPLFNVTVSNVVASKTPLYLRGAALEALYPMSILFDGYALNITLVGYCDRVAVGFTGCRETIPSLQKLAVYTGAALTEMERALRKRRTHPRPQLRVKAAETRARSP